MKAGFIGLGLIGGSIAKTIRRVFPDSEIVAYNRTQSVTEQAVADGVVNVPVDAVDARIGSCDYIFLCTPVVTMLSYLEELKPVLKDGAVITDVGSVKGGIHKQVQEAGLTHCFIGGHPMAGSEKTGYANATDRMIENAYYILTPEEDVDIHTVSDFSEFIGALGALPIVMSSDQHDYVTAAISHVPHVISASLVNMVHDLDDDARYMKTIAAGGFKDITRISSSSPQMWEEICLSNPDNICTVLDEYIRKLIDFRFVIRNGNEDKLLQYFSDCRDYRDSFDSGKTGPIRKSYRIYLDLADEPGAIAEIATILSLGGISIKNIGIVHNRDFEQGVLKIEFYDQAALEQGIERLEKKSYKIYNGD